MGIQSFQNAPHSRNDIKTTIYKTSTESDMHYSLPLEVGKVRGPDCYYMAIVDFQQKWTFRKIVERYFKVGVQGVDSDGLSAINPDAYYRRFCSKLEDLFDLTNTEYEYDYQERSSGKETSTQEKDEAHRDMVPASMSPRPELIIPVIERLPHGTRYRAASGKVRRLSNINTAKLHLDELSVDGNSDERNKSLRRPTSVSITTSGSMQSATSKSSVDSMV